MPLVGPDVLLVEELPGEHVAVIRLNRPERGNALTLELRERLRDAWLRLRDDDEVWAIVLTGSGDRSFSTGLDLHELARDHAEPAKPPAQRHAEMDLLVCDPLSLEVWKPIVAAINGYCLAGGWYLAQMCDLRVADESARFGIPEVRWNHPASFSWMLARTLPLNLALEAVLWGDQQFTAQRLYEMGFLNRVVPRGQALAVAIELARAVCRMGPSAVRMHKELLYRAAYPDVSALRSLGASLAYRLHTLHDTAEGVRAFVEKRQPQFRGR